MDCKTIIFVILLSVTAVIIPFQWILEIWSDECVNPTYRIGKNYNPSSGLKAFKDKYNPIDLGLDNFDDEAPRHIIEALVNATISNDPAYNQYMDENGLPKLRQAIAELYSPLIDQQLNPDENVLVTVGATEALYSAITTHTVVGEEWLIIEPAYHIYLPIVKQAGGVAKFISLKSNNQDDIIKGEDWKLDKNEFEGLISRKTKGIILNNPQNPIGKVWSLEELQFISSIARQYNLLIISDEAHEWITFKPHIRIGALPGLYERTITIGSASKTFSLGGWRIGWAYGPKDLLDPIKLLHMNVVDSTPAPQQVAIAFAFEEEIRNFGSPNSYFTKHREYVRNHRDMLVNAFIDVGLKPVITSGGFCTLVNWTSIKSKLPQMSKSMDFLVWLIKDIGVLGFPGTSYFSEEHQHIGQDYARFCYHKNIDTLKKAAQRLTKLKGFL
ncbi:kynurenine aminotransferase-like [Phymastichus coffea]|uniref:kynurenine aminotransferase-like n=1 Tax=Phymastichus coffea TaxID=108790 RepID=UPI00273AF28F|nr:kynurenine aminotransferase-like [Phymastichus coffea]